MPAEHEARDPEYSILKQRLARRLRYEGAEEEEVQDLSLVVRPPSRCATLAPASLSAAGRRVRAHSQRHQRSLKALAWSLSTHACILISSHRASDPAWLVAAGYDDGGRAHHHG